MKKKTHKYSLFCEHFALVFIKLLDQRFEPHISPLTATNSTQGNRLPPPHANIPTAILLFIRGDFITSLYCDYGFHWKIRSILIP